uniref:Uncharacterized protein n=1 Tax=Anopheles maculatus TaxID=74869 RepID=A0A182SPW9_9DIPT
LSLPRRRHHRRNLSSESTFFISSRDCSPVRRGKSPGSYYCGSLPRSIHSTPASSGYYKVSRSKQLSSADKLHSSDSQGKMEHKTSRSLGIASGPSSIDSGKMTYVTSGPSSFDSEKLSSTRTSTHSSLESHVSSSTITTAIQQQQQQQSGNSSLFMNNDTKPPSSASSLSGSPSRVAQNGSPKSSPPAPGTVTTVMTAVASTTKANNSYKCFETTFGYTSTNSGTGVKGNTPPSLAGRTSKSPTRPGGLGAISSLTKPIDHLTALSESLLQFRLNGDSTPNSGSSGASPPTSTTHTIPVQQNGTPELNKYNKNSTMNNSKPFQPMTSAPVQPPANFFYKNVLKNIQHDSKNICGDLAVEKTSPTRTYDEGSGRIGLQSNLRRSNSEIKKLNSNPGREGKLAEANDPKCGQTIPPAQPLSGLIVMKKSLSVSSEPNLLANGDSKAAQITILVQENGGTNHGTTERDNGVETDGRKRYSHYDELDRRFSYQNGGARDEPLVLEEMYEFPSLSDLSFNFTSLAAQKILQGDASLNSIDTLVELNINQEKQQTLMRLKNDARLLAQTVTPPAEPDAAKVMTDFGMV